MLTVPLQTTPAQNLSIILNAQSCQLRVYQRSTGLFVDVSINDALVIGGVLALDRNLIVRDPYLGFVGDLAFVDQMGARDPDYTGLGGRYVLQYFTPAEVTSLKR